MVFSYPLPHNVNIIYLMGAQNQERVEAINRDYLLLWMLNHCYSSQTVPNVLTIFYFRATSQGIIFTSMIIEQKKMFLLKPCCAIFHTFSILSKPLMLVCPATLYMQVPFLLNRNFFPRAVLFFPGFQAVL